MGGPGGAQGMKGPARWVRRRLQRFFQWLYEEGAWAYDGVAALASAGRWVHWVEQALLVLEGPRVLEIGHGPGHLLRAMARAGWHPVGLDRSAAMGRRARRRAGPSVPLVRGEAQRLPFRDRGFDTVVATFPAPFILEADTWAEVARVLRPGGRFVVLLGARPAPACPWRLLYRLAGLGPLGADLWVYLQQQGAAVGVAVRPWHVHDGRWRLEGWIGIREAREG
ncbi:MAG: class I SAM-dependent methyltransferase [Thermoflexus sp.]|uniref:class I SAM-dependent methyltransferase n=1 Tax=Thermoflexus sp. TaxID=1969742 RepID=UPI0033186029